MHRLTGLRCAVKQIPRSLAPPLLTREIHHHRRLHHDNIVQLYEVVATESSIWLVSELCSGGELYDYLVEKGHLPEHEARRVFGQLALAVGYIHRQGVVHRDLKLENVLLDERCNVKLADFGFGREFERNKLLESFCGTTGYAAPEMLQGRKYLGEEVDIWSLGIILYTLLAGSLPFDDDDEHAMKSKIVKGEFDMPLWISEDAAALITGILKPEPRERLSIPEILGHVWFTRPPPEEQLGRDSSFSVHQRPVSIVEEPSRMSIEEERPPSADTSDSLGSPATTPLTSEDDGSDAKNSPFAPRTLGLFGSESPLPSPSLVLNHRNMSDVTLKRHDSPLKSATTRSALAAHPEGFITSSPSTDQWGMLGMRSPPSPLPYTMTRTDSASSAGLVHLRTPSRTKRRSVSSIVSERQAPSGTPPLPDFLALLSVPTPDPLEEPLGKSLLASLSTLGFETGQITHSVATHACDPAGAIYWMLRRKALDREMEKQELSEEQSRRVPPSPHSVSSVLPPLKEAKSQAEMEAMLTPIVKAPSMMSTSTSLPTLSLTADNPPISPSKSHRSLSPSTPLAELSSSSASASPDAGGDGVRVKKPRSSSISMLQRATSALGVSSKRNEDGEEGSKPSLGGLFARRPLLGERKSGDRLRSVSAETSSHQTSPRGSPALRTRQESETTVPRSPSPKSSRTDLLLPGQPPMQTQEHAESFDTLLSASSAGSSSARANTSNSSKTRSRNSLFTSFKQWFNEDKKKRKRMSTLSTSTVSPQRSNYVSYGRSQTPSQSSPLRRPPIQQRRSSTSQDGVLVGRRSSITSAGSPLIGGGGHRRRQSDSSRISATGSMSDTPSRGTARSYRNEDGSLSRRIHSKSGSFGSSTAGSRRMLHSNSPSTYRRTPTTTQVRRIPGPIRRPSFSGTENDSPDESQGPSRRSSIIDHGPQVEVRADQPTIIEEDDEDPVEAERAKALSKLSGAALKPGPAVRRSIDVPRRRNTSATSASRRSSVSSGPGSPTATVFTAHKSTHLFGSPSNSWSRSSVPAPRTHLRDVFARSRQSRAEDGEWIDDGDVDDGFDGFSSGFGQGRTPPATEGDANGNPSTPAAPAAIRPTSMPVVGSSTLGEGRYAAMTGETTTRRAVPQRAMPSFKAGVPLEEEEEEE